MKKLLLAICCLSLFFKGISQNILPPCATTDVMKKEMQKDPDFKRLVEQVEQQIEQYAQRQKGSRTSTAGPVYTIPVVVHLIYTGQTDCTPSNLNIANDKIRQAFDVASANYNSRPANKSNGYSRYTSPTDPMYDADSAGIKFCLATRGPANPDGTGSIIDYPTGAVLRYDGSLSSTWANSIVGTPASNATDYVTYGLMRSANGVDEDNLPYVGKWDVTKYYNVYLISQIDGNKGGNGTQGWAYYPTSSAVYDRAVMLIKDFNGPSGGGAVTFTHEGGHALNLYHTFDTDGISGNTSDPYGNTCSNSPNPETNCATQGDKVCDTPPSKSHLGNSCSGANDVATNSCYPSSKEGDVLHNYMDYTNCANMFTAGQSARMRAVLSAATTTNRYKQAQPGNVSYCGCDGTNKPSTLFSANNVNPCVGTPTQFNDESLYSPTSWSWTFTPATVSYSGGTSSISKNPQVAFNALGTYTVKLKVTNAYGSDSLTKTTYISTTNGASMPFTEGFESVTFVPAGWNNVSSDPATSFGTDGTKTWERLSVSGNAPSTAAACLNFYNYSTNNNEIDNIISTPIAISTGSSPYLSFKVAYKNYPNSANYDELKVYLSTDCGATYGSALYSKSGPTLASNGSSSSQFTPSVTADWRKDSISLSAFEGQTVVVKFEAVNKWGNNLYLDDINVRGSVATPPTANFTANSTSICENSSVTFTNTSSGSVSTYSWNFGSGASPATANTAGPHAVAYSTAGSKNVTLSVSGSSGSDSETKTNYIVVNANPTATNTPAGATTFCSGGSVTLNANTGGITAHQWKRNGSTNVGTNSSYSATSAGSYTVVVTSTNTCTAVSPAVIVTVDPLPTSANASANQTICASSTVMNGNAPSIGTGTWTLIGGSGTIVNPNSPGSSITGIGLGTNTFRWTISNGTCSPSFDDMVIQRDATPSVSNAGPDQQLCGTSATLAGNNPVTGAGSWSLISGSGTITNINDPASGITGLGIGDNTFRWTISNGTCANSSSDVLLNRDNTVASISTSGSTSICDGASVTLNANTGANLSYQWKKDGSNVGTNSSTYVASSIGSYSVDVTNSLTTCSASSSPIDITVGSNPTATINPVGSTTFCEGTTVTLNANTGAGLTYRWYKDGIEIIGSTSSSYIAWGGGNYVVEVTSGTCSVTSTPITLNLIVSPNAGITPGGSTTFCDGGSVLLNANTSGIIAHQWKKDGNNIGNNSPNYDAVSTGDYTVVVTNSSNCTAVSSPVSVLVNPLPLKPVINQTGNTLNCSASSGSFQWYLDGSEIAGATNSSHTASTNGIYTVTNTVNNCSSTSDPLAVTGVVGILNSMKNEINIYPNPAKNMIVIEGEFKSNNVVITVTDLLGNQVLKNTSNSSSKIFLNTESFADGIYYLNINWGNERLTRKITVIK